VGYHGGFLKPKNNFFLLKFGDLIIIFTFVSDYLLLMTEKGEKILEAALELFVKNGFDGTSTIEIAKKAGVSEALIFKHFKSKAGLLESIVKKGQEILNKPIRAILNEKNPEKIINKTLELPVVFYSDESQYWKLMMDFKSKNEDVRELMHRDESFEQLMKRIESAFEILNFKEPKKRNKPFIHYCYGFE